MFFVIVAHSIDENTSKTLHASFLIYKFLVVQRLWQEVHSSFVEPHEIDYIL